MKKEIVLAIIFAGLGLLIAVLVASCAATGAGGGPTGGVAGITVSITTIESTGDVGLSASLAIDTNDKTHICYRDDTNGYLKYATNASGTWEIETIENHFYDGYTTMALDSNNKVHIAFFDTTGFGARYAHNDSGTWEVEYLPLSTVAYPSIAVDSNNKIHLTCYKYIPEDLYYLTNTSGSWSATTVESTNDSGEWTSLDLDSNNKAHICFRYAVSSIMGPYSTKYATNVSGSWVVTTLEAGRSGYYYSLKVASDDKVHISYQDAGANLVYATNTTGSWALTTVESPAVGNAGAYCSITLDSSNRPHISHTDSYSSIGYLKYSTKASGSWQNYILDYGDYSTGGANTSIAIDSNGKFHIACYDATNRNLMYVVQQ